MPCMKQLVALLNSAIETKVVTITELSTTVGCSRQHIYNILQGKQDPTVHIAEQLANAIGASLTLTFKKNPKKISA